MFEKKKETEVQEAIPSLVMVVQLRTPSTVASGVRSVCVGGVIAFLR